MNYEKLKSIVLKHNVKGKYRFINRGTSKDKLCILLVGYKEFLWATVIDRLKRFIPKDIDVCLLSSGVHLAKLEAIAEANNWSYLSTKKNNVCLAQNIAIHSFPNAKLIYKIDEDIFLTEGVFEKLENALDSASKSFPYHIGMVAPLLNINGYGYYRILTKLGKLEVFEEKFGRAIMESGQETPIENDLRIAQFMWGKDNFIPQLDAINARFSSSNDITICPIRLSIGCILLKRSFWESFWRFPVIFGNGIGLDETVAIGAASAFSQILIVAENSVVGHFGYGPQTNAMKEFMNSNPKLFH